MKEVLFDLEAGGRVSLCFEENDRNYVTFSYAGDDGVKHAVKIRRNEAHFLGNTIEQLFREWY